MKDRVVHQGGVRRYRRNNVVKHVNNMFDVVRSGRVRRVGGVVRLNNTRVTKVGVRTTVSIVVEEGRVRRYAVKV